MFLKNKKRHICFCFPKKKKMRPKLYGTISRALNRLGQAGINKLTEAGGRYVRNRIEKAIRGQAIRGRPVQPHNATIPTGVLRLKKTGASMSRMAGFFKKGRNYKKSRRNKMTIKGVNLVKEAGGVIGVASPCTKCAYIVHASLPLYTVRRHIWRAVLKRLYEKMNGYSPESLDISIGSALDSFTVYYRINGNYGTQTFTGTAWTINTLSAALAQDTVAWHINDDQIQLLKIQFIPVASSPHPITAIRLLDTTVQFYSKATLKLQNRTIGANGTEADEVDNVPLSGYYYGGKGAGPFHKNTVAQPVDFTADNNAGLQIVQATTASLPEIQEPPLAGDFAYVQRSGKARFNPGDIKTSTLVSRLNMDFNKLYMRLVNAAGTSNPGIRASNSTLGDYRMFALEKMIETASDPSTQPSILLAYEHNIRMMCSISEKYSMNTVQTYEYN